MVAYAQTYQGMALRSSKSQKTEESLGSNKRHRSIQKCFWTSQSIMRVITIILREMKKKHDE